MKLVCENRDKWYYLSLNCSSGLVGKRVAHRIGDVEEFELDIVDMSMGLPIVIGVPGWLNDSQVCVCVYVCMCACMRAYLPVCNSGCLAVSTTRRIMPGRSGTRPCATRRPTAAMRSLSVSTRACYTTLVLHICIWILGRYEHAWQSQS